MGHYKKKDKKLPPEWFNLEIYNPIQNWGLNEWGANLQQRYDLKDLAKSNQGTVLRMLEQLRDGLCTRHQLTRGSAIFYSPLMHVTQNPKPGDSSEDIATWAISEGWDVCQDFQRITRMEPQLDDIDMQRQLDEVASLKDLAAPISYWAHVFALELARLNGGRVNVSIAMHRYAQTLTKAAIDGVLTVRDTVTNLPVTVSEQTDKTSPNFLFNESFVTKDDLRTWVEEHCPDLRTRLLGFDIHDEPPKASQAEKDNIPPGLPKRKIALAFDGIYWTYEQWERNLGDCPNWLKSARMSRGARGKAQSTWNPVEIGALLLDKNNDLKIMLNKAFRTHDVLSGWAVEWQEYMATLAEYSTNSPHLAG